MNKQKIGELLLILGTVLFVGGAAVYITTGQILKISALAIIFIGMGAGMKKMK